jgi:hypothetical protein
MRWIGLDCHLEFIEVAILDTAGVVDEHSIAIDDAHPAGCTPDHDCGGHEAGHAHGPGCGHEAVPHGDHVDYLVSGHLHHPHDGHCDDHGALELA